MHHTLAYRKSDFCDDGAMFARMRRDLVTFLFDHLDYSHTFDRIKLYYDE